MEVYSGQKDACHLSDVLLDVINDELYKLGAR